MKRITAIFLIGISLSTMAQETSVEKSVSGIQTGWLGVWIHNELKLTNSIALRSEIGFDPGYDSFLGGYFKNNGFIMTPVLTLEPRYYYNLGRRVSKFKDIAGNNGSFFSLNISYHPNWFVVPDKKKSNTSRGIFATPTWGIRRNLGKHFNYESAFGLGYGYQYYPERYKYYDGSAFTINTHLRVGYRF